MYNGVQMLKELKHELANLYDAYDAYEHEREIERMRDDLLPDNCTGQDFADKVNTLIWDHKPYVQVLYVGERLGRLIIKLLPTALVGEDRARLRTRANGQEATGQRKPLNRGHHATRENGASPGSGLGSTQTFQQKGQKGDRSFCGDAQARPDGRSGRRGARRQTALVRTPQRAVMLEGDLPFSRTTRATQMDPAIVILAGQDGFPKKISRTTSKWNASKVREKTTRNA
eukprot:3636919-Pleurochrysis_carterae.AAC.5